MLKRDLYYERISTKSLRDDVRYLGNILGRVIKDQEGKKFFDLVEKTRLLSKANIANRSQKNLFRKLSIEIRKCNPDFLTETAQLLIDEFNDLGRWQFAANYVPMSIEQKQECERRAKSEIIR